MLSSNIKKLRKQKELSQDQLVRVADIPYNTLVKIEAGKSNNPTFETLSKLADLSAEAKGASALAKEDALEISIDKLAGRTK